MTIFTSSLESETKAHTREIAVVTIDTTGPAPTVCPGLELRRSHLVFAITHCLLPQIHVSFTGRKKSSLRSAWCMVATVGTVQGQLQHAVVVGGPPSRTSCRSLFECCIR